MYPITARTYDARFNQIVATVFDMNLLEGSNASTAESIFASVAKQFSDHKLSWDYCMGT